MSTALSRQSVRHGVAVIAIVLAASAQAANPALTPDGVAVPHFGTGKPKTCVPLVRQRIRAVMNDKSTAQFEARPPAGNRPCR